MNSFYRFASTKRNERQELLSKIKIVGLVTTEAFQKARLLALKLHVHLPYKFATPEIREMLQIEWRENLTKMRRCVGGEMWKLDRPVVVFIDGEFIGDDIQFSRHMSKNYAFYLPVQSSFYKKLIVERYRHFIEKSARKYAYFTFTVDDKVIGSFLFMLYTDLVPRTCEHFLKLCTGLKSDIVYGTELSYKNTKVHRIVKNGWLQLGDFLEPHEDIADSLVDEITIHAECYCVPHDRRGVLSMANDGKHTNRDQFVVSLKSNDWMNRHYVAFGQLVDGAKTLETIENISTYYEAPLKTILITECGEYSFEREAISKMKKPKKFGIAEGEENEENPTFVDYEKSHSYPDISAWSRNIPDTIDDRDAASVLMNERYAKGLYSLCTDNSSDSSQISIDD